MPGSVNLGNLVRLRTCTAEKTSFSDVADRINWHDTADTPSSSEALIPAHAGPTAADVGAAVTVDTTQKAILPLTGLSIAMCYFSCYARMAGNEAISCIMLSDALHSRVLLAAQFGNTCTPLHKPRRPVLAMLTISNIIVSHAKLVHTSSL